MIRPDHIGDMLFASPALRTLRTALPDAQLTAMVGPWGEAVWRNNSYLNEIIVCRFPAPTRRPKTSLLARTTSCSSALGRYEPGVLTWLSSCALIIGGERC